MSPEQLNDEPVDGRSDLFSLGVILYTILTGYRPFQGNSALTVAFKVVNRDPIPATILDTGLSPGLDYIISRAIAKDPSQRYQRGIEMVLDIEDLRAGREPWSKTKRPPSVPGTAQPGKPSPSALITQLTGGLKPQSSTRPLQGGTVHHFPEDLRKISLAGVLLLIGLLIFAVRVGQVAWPRGDISLATPLAQVAAPRPGANVAAQPVAPKTLEKKPRKASLRRPSSTPKITSLNMATSPAMLEIEVDHRFADAHMAIWVDEELTYTHPLAGLDKKHLIVFHRVQGHEFHAVQIPPGKHLLRVQVSPGSGANDQSGTVEGEFAGGSEKMLRVQFGKSGVMNLRLE
jgi:serine/threonine-protein kinase